MEEIAIESWKFSIEKNDKIWKIGPLEKSLHFLKALAFLISE